MIGHLLHNNVRNSLLLEHGCEKTLIAYFDKIVYNIILIIIYYYLLFFLFSFSIYFIVFIVDERYEYEHQRLWSSLHSN